MVEFITNMGWNEGALTCLVLSFVCFGVIIVDDFRGIGRAKNRWPNRRWER